MNLPPALTWLQLFPWRASCTSDAGVPNALRAMLERREADMMARNGSPEPHPRVLVSHDRPWHEMVELPKCDGIAAVNCPGVTTRALEAAGFTYARRFIVVPSLENARWFISTDSPRVAGASFSLYTPARRSAHVKKAVAKFAAMLRLPIGMGDRLIIASRTLPPLERKLAELFPGRSIRVALSAGAPEPARNRKASACVIGEGGEILAFAKIADSSISKHIARHEAEMLPALGDRSGLPVAPKLLFAGDVDGRFVTVQTPLPGRPAPARMTPAHLRFLKAMRNGPSKPASATAMVSSLPGRLAALPAPHPELSGVLEAVMPTLDGATVTSTIIHGDFAPWNLRSHRGEVSAFDWEYGELDGLPLVDETHYLLQLGFLLHQWNLEQAHQCLSDIAASRPLGLSPEQVRAIHVVYVLDQLVRLYGEGYDAGNDMVAWYGKLLERLHPPAAAPHAVPAAREAVSA